MTNPTWPTVQDFTFDLSTRLRDAACASLAELEANISRDGFDWLEDYLDNIQAQGRRGAIADLIKTPSRTATAKKTRANTTATKNRADQVRMLNERVALSPLVQSPNVRPPFSPLGTRLNVLQSPTPASPLKSKSKLAVLESTTKESKPSKSKKTRAKQNAGETSAKTKENAMDERSTRAIPKSTSVRLGLRGAVPKSPSPEPLNKSKVAPEIQEAQMAVDEVTDNNIASISQQLGETVDNIVNDSPPVLTDPIKEPGMEPEPFPAELIITDDTETRLDQPTFDADTQRERSSPVKTLPAVQPAVEPPVPVRSVRSSWLTHALGTSTVPVNGMDHKSYASSSHRQSTSMDPTDALRKSTAASGSLKRKSEDGPGLDTEPEQPGDGKRAEKVARFGNSAQNPSPVRRALFPRTPASAPASDKTSTTPAFPPVARPSVTSAPAENRRTGNVNNVNHMDKVTRALDEFRETRERAAAAALANQKANTLATAEAVVGKASTAKAAYVPTATSTGAGFLRGLGNLGAGFLSRSTTEEEASRAQLKEEEDRRVREEAEEAMARMLRAMAEAETKVGSTSQAEQPRPAAGSTRSIEVNMDPDVGAEPDQIIEDVEDSIELPELPTPDIADEYEEIDAEGVASALGAAGIDIDFEVRQSTTPTATPPRARQAIPVRSPAYAKSTSKIPQVVISPPVKSKPTPLASHPVAPLRYEPKSSTTVRTDNVPPQTEQVAKPVHKPVRSRLESSTASSLAKSNHQSMLAQSQKIAAKTLGAKPETARPKSIMQAQEAAKKEQERREQRNQAREKVQQKKNDDIARKAEEDRLAKAEDERKRKAEDEEKRRVRLENEQKRRENEQRQIDSVKPKPGLKAPIRTKQAQADDSSKRIGASTLTKSSTTSTIKRVQPTTSVASVKGGARTGPPVTASSNSLESNKPGPNTFRLAKTSTSHVEQYQGPASSSQVAANAAPAPERRPLGPPSRASQAAGGGAAVLKNSRATLIAQLDQKAQTQQSEDIVLPDIASEYSDSEDEDKETDFNRPGWAESPELKRALADQADINPDELFGPIRPLQMDELFKARAGKFRARTSSANWAGADRLTEAEQREYARRMGYSNRPQ